MTALKLLRTAASSIVIYKDMGPLFSLFTCIAISVLLTTCASVPVQEVGSWRNQLELPALTAGEQVQKREGYTFSFDFTKRVPRWVAYSLTKDQTAKTEIKRMKRFKNDPRLPEAAKKSDYRNSNYDRGHLAPAGALQWSAASMYDSFLMTNTAPQVPSFNRVVWRLIEELVTLKARESDEIYVTTGPVLTEACMAKLADKICVARRFFKVAVAIQGENLQAMAFLVPQNASQEEIKQTSIDEVEKATGIDFFPRLPDDIEEMLESGIDSAVATK